LEATRRRALHAADLYEHHYATLEHLLLALLEDTDARSVMVACDGNLEGLKNDLIQAIDDGQDNSVSGTGRSAEPSKAFQRTLQRAAVHAQEVGWPVVTGANALFALFAETRSPAARLLHDRGVSMERAAKAIAQGIGKGLS
jgi:ATP-dependent Lon protease